MFIYKNMKKMLVVGAIALVTSLPAIPCHNSPSVENSSVKDIVLLSPQDYLITLNPAEPNGEHGWYVTPVEVTFHAKEGPGPGTSGLKYIYYQINSRSWITHEIPGAPPDLPMEYDFSIIVDIDGQHVVRFKAEDWVGNVGPIHSVEFKIDMTSPVVSIGVPQEGYIWGPGRCLMPRIFIKNVAIILQGFATTAVANDNMSSIWMVQFKINGNSFMEDAQSPFEAIMPSLPVIQFRYELAATALDYAGNSATTPIVNFTKIL